MIGIVDTDKAAFWADTKAHFDTVFASSNATTRDVLVALQAVMIENPVLAYYSLLGLQSNARHLKRVPSLAVYSRPETQSTAVVRWGRVHSGVPRRAVRRLLDGVTAPRAGTGPRVVTAMASSLHYESDQFADQQQQLC
jgi:hypothetical protein